MYMFVGHKFKSGNSISFPILMPEGFQTADQCWQDIADSIYLQFMMQHSTWNPAAELRAYSMDVVVASN